MRSFQIIDCHLHTGIQNVNWRWEDIRTLLLNAGITGAGAIPPVEDVYDRYDPDFTDTPAWQACRHRAHKYLLDLHDPEIQVFPYFFVWNDFAWEDLGPEYAGIKWHRHQDEPEYDYGSPKCRKFLDKVREKGLSILLEETLENTLFFLDKMAPDLPVIIPHLGALNGGYRALDAAGVWGRDLIWADTALAGMAEIKDYLGRYGSERLMFGSDYPFSRPDTELAKILSLDLPESAAQAILGGNFRRLCRLG